MKTWNDMAAVASKSPEWGNHSPMVRRISGYQTHKSRMDNRFAEPFCGGARGTSTQASPAHRPDRLSGYGEHFVVFFTSTPQYVWRVCGGRKMEAGHGVNCRVRTLASGHKDFVEATALQPVWSKSLGHVRYSTCVNTAFHSNKRHEFRCHMNPYHLVPTSSLNSISGFKTDVLVNITVGLCIGLPVIFLR